MRIKEVIARKILDSRKQETIEIVLKTTVGKTRASSPSGKSRGKYEVHSFAGKIDNSMKMLNAVSKEISYLNFEKFQDLSELENLLEKRFRNKKAIGANVLLALEIAILQGIAKEKNMPLWRIVKEDFWKTGKLPMPVGNVIGGGLHSQGQKPDFQEFLVIPKVKNFKEAVKINKKIYKLVKKALKKRDKDFEARKNDENAWQTSLDNETILEILQEVRDKVEGMIGKNIEIGLDLASSSFFNKTYNYKNKEAKRTQEEQIEYIKNLSDKFAIFYLEDPLNEENFTGFSLLRRKLKDKLIVADDLTVTNIERLQRAVQERAINGIIVKPNQNGSLIETRKICDFARKHGIKIILSHRSGETNDDWLADLAFGFQADYIKTGVAGKERKAKLKRMMAIERSLRARV